jgi:hypothetical protein
MTSELSEQNETRQERLLRAALREHAPAEIDVEGAWATVAARVSVTRGARAGRAGRPRSGVTALMSTQRALLIAAVMAIVLLLAGAGLGAAYWGGIFGGEKAGLIGDEQLYTTINQSQTVGDVTITIDKVYADPGNTYISIMIRVPQSVARQYNTAVLNHFGVSDASGQDSIGANLTCDPLPHDGSAEHCMIDYGPFQPNADGAHVTLTVEVGEVWLLRPNVHDPDVRSGPWRFTFTLPFHQPSLGPGGPYAQPSPGRNP